MMILYTATNILNQKVYVGITKKTFSKRIDDHIRSVIKGSLVAFHRAIRKYGIIYFDWKIVKNNIASVSDLKKHEIDLIRYLKQEDVVLYNMTNGGDGTIGLKFSNERKKKISNALSGRTLSNEHKKNLSDSKLGIQIGPFSEQTKEKMRKPKSEEHKKHIRENHFRGKLPSRGALSSEHKQKIRDAAFSRYGTNPQSKNVIKRRSITNNQKKMGICVLQIDRQTGNVIRSFYSIGEAARVVGISKTCISQACRGLLQTAAGFCWSYEKNVESCHV
jgi:group I intron endonuclease